MSMTTWAENEVKLACKRENPDRKEGEWDYGCSCYESALKAYKSLMADGHSGASFGITKGILIRLLNEKPLTPIDDTEDVWEEVSDDIDNTMYQCYRLGSLFKTVWKETGKVEYKDINMAVGIDVEKDTAYHSGLIDGIINNMFPVTIPYYPQTNPYRVYAREYLIPNREGGNSGYNIVEVAYCVKPDGEKLEINRYFAEKNSVMAEISKEEFGERMTEYGKLEITNKPVNPTERNLNEDVFERYTKEPKWKGKVFTHDEKTCFIDGYSKGLNTKINITRISDNPLQRIK